MDYARLQQLRANRVIAYNNLYMKAEKGRIFKSVTLTEYNNQRNGGMRIIDHYKIYYEAIEPEISAGTTMNGGPCITLIAQIFLALEDLLVYNASISLPPTKSARISYLWFFTVAAGYSWITPGSITGTKDSWNWDTKNLLSDDTAIFVWMTQVLVNTMSNFIPSYNTSLLLEQDRMNFGWTEQQHQAVIDQVKSQGNFSLWLSTWQTWYTGRQNDGNVAAGTAATDAELPNGATTLDVTTSQDFTNATAYPNPRKWTPLKVGGVKKNFLTYGWGTVNTTCLTAGDETPIKSAANIYYLDTTDATKNTARNAEIDNLVTLTNSLTDTQKAIAEFWAGGPLTVSPPCMMIWFWKKYIELVNPAVKVMIYSGLELAINIFEGSRLTWALKRENMEARPIQEIRRRYAGQNVTNYDGTIINGNLWVPYQETNFVTPPFPDFPSGHSTFSQAFANVMNAWFSPTIPPTMINMTDLYLLSPMYTGLGTLTNSLSDITVKARTSKIQTGLVPASDVHLTWSVWQDIADSAGVSRQYGGIHAVSANLGGQAVANTAFPLITSRWAISHT
jgi:hypothetical protein